MTLPSADRESDKKFILDHIETIFEAIATHDRDALIRTHLPEFCGFSVRSRGIIRGREQYLGEIQGLLKEGRYQSHEITDIAFQFHGQTAVVAYIARIAFTDQAGTALDLKLRGLDVYIQETGGWNLLACNTNVHPDEIDRRLAAASGNC
ncbi:MAG TPA: nuclear transport factor 2 family protein [Holophaga sp.]|nr:nuclear transport factor 2 family protein [Holophaga sp.]